jgi:fructose-1,6-bisphosphatase/sedoheptulose 1,7-bisphosphatase-like protein
VDTSKITIISAVAHTGARRRALLSVSAAATTTTTTTTTTNGVGSQSGGVVATATTRKALGSALSGRRALKAAKEEGEKRFLRKKEKTRQKSLT